MKSVELCAGAGGLAMGVAQAGFEHLGIVECDQWCCETINHNRLRGARPIADWPAVSPTDIKHVRFDGLPADIDLVSGGPPCQPFSLGGKHRGHADARNLFPDLVRAVRVLRPHAVIVENVKGLLRKSFDPYFKYILLTLTYPTLVPAQDESWPEHMARLERHHTSGGELEYRVDFELLNAADYGVPQRRERVFIDRLSCGPSASNGHFGTTCPRPTLQTAFYGTSGSPASIGLVTTFPWRDARRRLPAPGRVLNGSPLPHFLRPAGRGEPSATRFMTFPIPVQMKPPPSPTTVSTPGPGATAATRGVCGTNPRRRSRLVTTACPEGKTLSGIIRMAASATSPSGRPRACRRSPMATNSMVPGRETMRQLGNAVPVQLSFSVADSVAKVLRRDDSAVHCP